jgi:hypothetical protein
MFAHIVPKHFGGLEAIIDISISVRIIRYCVKNN